MAYSLSQYALDIKEAATLRMAQAARELVAAGQDVLNLSIGQPDFDTPEYIKQAAVAALADGYTGYTPVPGLLELREAIAEKFAVENHLGYKPEQIMVSNGAKQSIANICFALLNPGDEVILPAPYWVSYESLIRQRGASPVVIQTRVEDGFKMRPQDLAASITERSKLLLYSNPSNPTGSVYSRAELSAIAEVLEQHPQVMVLSDEIYEYINFIGNHHSIAELPAMRERTIVVNGFSKGFAMTGWRLGYMAGPAGLIKACSKIQGQMTSGACAFGQKAGVTALTAGREACVDMRESYRSRRDLVGDALQQIPGLRFARPDGAFYYFIDASDYYGLSNGSFVVSDSESLCQYLLQHGLVATVPGVAFGDDRCFRISFATSNEVLTDAVQRIGRALSELV